MEIKERNTLIAAISFITGIIFLIFVLPYLIYPSMLLGFYGIIIIDFFILANTLFLYGVFLIKPIKTLRGKENLAKGAMIIGGILIILPLIGMGYMFFAFFPSYMYFLYNLMNTIPFIILLIPGVALFIHGRFLYKKPRTSNVEE